MTQQSLFLVMVHWQELNAGVATPIALEAKKMWSPAEAWQPCQDGGGFQTGGGRKNGGQMACSSTERAPA